MLLIEKFTQNPELGKLLVETHPATLVEGNWWHDQFWGDCTCKKHADIPGANMLGKRLMRVRERL
jgi:predicted NAD-dependent protein-ADP-ribosyltransferase YbiA (DUF1768 family)